jgi:hypothetical protein
LLAPLLAYPLAYLLAPGPVHSNTTKNNKALSNHRLTAGQYLKQTTPAGQEARLTA